MSLSFSLPIVVVVVVVKCRVLFFFIIYFCFRFACFQISDFRHDLLFFVFPVLFPPNRGKLIFRSSLSPPIGTYSVTRLIQNITFIDSSSFNSSRFISILSIAYQHKTKLCNRTLFYFFFFIIHERRETT